MIEEVQRPELTIPSKEQHERRRPHPRHGEGEEREPEEEFNEVMEQEIVVEIGSDARDDDGSSSEQEQEPSTEKQTTDSSDDPSAMIEKLARGIDIVI